MPERARLRLRFPDAHGRIFERAGVGEERVAVTNGERPAFGRRSAFMISGRVSFHGLGFMRTPCNWKKSPSKSKSSSRPDFAQRVDPFLTLRVAPLVIARPHAEHLEFAFVPTAHDVQPEAPLADVVGGDHLLGRDDRREQRRVNGSEHLIRSVFASSPVAHVIVSNVAPW